MSMNQSHTVNSLTAADQAERREKLLLLHRQHWWDRFDGRGDYVGNDPGDFRQRMWHAAAFLEAGADYADRASAMLGHLVPLDVDHFWTAGVAFILKRYSRLIDDRLADRLRDKLAEVLPGEARQTFRGYNDNYPAMAAFSAIVGGEMLDDTHAVAGGLANLDSMRRLLTRRGCLTEYASPTYSPITLRCLASVVELAEHPEACALARFGEERVWLNIASRFHPATSSVAGPHSRAYMIDMLAHTHNLHVVLWLTLGDKVFVNPAATLFPPIKGHADHNGMTDWMSHGIQYALTRFHPPSIAIELALEKKMPMTVRASTEQAAFPRNVWEPKLHPHTPYAEFAAGPAHLTTYLEDDFALGTSSRVCMDGDQHTGVHLVYRRRRPTGDEPASMRDVGTLFARYLTGEPAPDRHRHLGDQGRTMCVQHKSTAVVAAWPKLGWGHNPVHQDAVSAPTTSLALCLFVPNFWGNPQELWLGSQRCDGWSAESGEPVSIFLKDGPVCIAIHPLAIDQSAGQRDVAIRLRQINGFGVIQLINFKGEPQTFTPAELLSLRNGFAIEVSAGDTEHDFEAFRGERSDPEIKDCYHRSDGMRYVSFESSSPTSSAMELVISPISEGVKYRAIDETPVEEPRLSIPGTDLSKTVWIKPS